MGERGDQLERGETGGGGEMPVMFVSPENKKTLTKKLYRDHNVKD